MTLKRSPDETRLLHVTDRSAWRDWLKTHYKSEHEVWLVYYKKHTGKPRIPYNDAVEEALCFGWIDSIVKRVDEDSYAQRFSPRKRTSRWSQPNIERMQRLIKLGKMTPAGLAALKDPALLAAHNQKVKIAPDILKALKADKQTWVNFQRFPDMYKRIRIAYIEGSRERGESEFQKRLQNFLKKTKENKQFSFGGVQCEILTPSLNPSSHGF